MPKQYRTREGEATAVDSKTALTTAGSDSSPGALNAPQGCTKLKGILAAGMSNFAAAGSSSIFVRLEGSGLPQGPEIIALGAVGGNITTGMHGLAPAELLDIDIPVTPGNEILVYLEMAGVDSGQVSGGVTLVFE